MSKPARKYESDVDATVSEVPPPTPQTVLQAAPHGSGKRGHAVPDRVRQWAVLALMLGAVWAHGAPARADSTVIVLSVRALDGDDDLAHRLSDALRTESTTIPDWQVSDREVSLAQMSLAHGCTEPSANCMADIAKTLEVDRLIYGTSERTNAGVRVTLHNYDAVTGHVEGSFDNLVSEEAIGDENLPATARRMVEQLAGTVILGRVRVQVNIPSAEVYLDDQHVGIVEAADSLVLHDVPAGSHTLAVEGAGQRAEKQIDVPAGVEAQAVFQLSIAAPPPPPVAVEEDPPETPTPERPRMRIAGYVTLGIAGGLLAATGITWARLGALSDGEELNTYRDMFPGPDEPGGTSDVCIEARAGDPGDSTHPGIAGRVADVCDKGDLLEKLQWVFLSTAIAAAGIGTALLLVDRHHRREYALSISPRLSRGSAGLSARLTF